MWMIQQQEKAEDFVIATGVTTTIRKFVQMAFAEIGISIEFRGENEGEIGFVVAIDEDKLKQLQVFEDCKLKIGQEVVAVDSRYFRPTEVELLIGDPTKSKTKLGWTPRFDLSMLITDMVTSDLKKMRTELFLNASGHDVIKQYE